MPTLFPYRSRRPCRGGTAYPLTFYRPLKFRHERNRYNYEQEVLQSIQVIWQEVRHYQRGQSALCTRVYSASNLTVTVCRSRLFHSVHWYYIREYCAVRIGGRTMTVKNITEVVGSARVCLMDLDYCCLWEGEHYDLPEKYMHLQVRELNAGRYELDIFVELDI